MAQGEEGYNGWANYESWVVGLWLSNDEGTYLAACKIVRVAGDPPRAADALKKWVEDQNPLADDASMFSDLMGQSLSRVDWVEVARSLGPDE